jgi:hypothetical protein
VFGFFGGVSVLVEFFGHYIRSQPAGGNLFSYVVGSGLLEPLPQSQQFTPFQATGLKLFERCPGGATQPNAGWPTPTDHPFLDDGNLNGLCNPDDVPPGP